MAMLDNPARFERQRQAWQRLRQRGKLSFIFYRGILLWGGCMFVFSTCTDVLIRHDHLDESPAFLTIDALVWLLSGMIWGIWIWHRSEKRFGEPGMK
jgi:hypothetical protein